MNSDPLYAWFEKSTRVASTTRDKAYAVYGSATTTFNLWNPSGAVKISKLYCKTDAGTANLRIGDGANFAYATTASNDTLKCSTAGVEKVFTTNNTFTTREDVLIQLGTQASSNEVIVTATFDWD